MLRGEVQPFVSNQLHLVEQGGIPGEVDFLAVWSDKKKAARLAAVRTVRQAGAGRGRGQLKRSE
jgi:hypothetical protein